MSKTNVDNRMQWVLKLEELQQAKDDIPVYYTEYEICSEVRIPGVLTYGDGMIECSLYQEADDNGLYTYTLKIKHLEKVFEYDEDNYSKDGYYFKEGLIGEIIALFSFHFQIRFYLKATITGEMSAVSIRSRLENKFLYRKINDDLTCLNLEMFSSQERNWVTSGLNDFLDSVRALDQSYHQNLIQSLHWYSKAVKEVGVDHELFFIKMVSSIETLLNVTGAEPDALATKLTELNKGGTFKPEEWMQLKGWLANRMIRRRFAEFFEKYSDGFSGDVPEKAAHCYIAKDQIPTYLKRIYDARSSYLHTGKSMFLSDDLRSEEMKKWDLDPSMGMRVDRKKIPEKEKLPRTRWFERVINYSIKSFITSSSDTSS